MKEKNYLSDVFTFSALLISVHYFLSYYLIILYLKDYNLNITSILSCEDVLFTTATLSMLSFIGIEVTSFISIIYLSYTMRNLEFRKSRLYTFVKNTTKKTKIIGIIIISAIIVSLIYFFYEKTTLPIKICFCSFIIGLLLYKSLGYKILYIILLGSFMINTFFIYSETKKTSSQLYSNDVRLHLDNDSIVESNQKHRLIFWGTKYIAIQKDSTKNVLLYPVSQIKQIEWINH